MSNNLRIGTDLPTLSADQLAGHRVHCNIMGDDCTNRGATSGKKDAILCMPGDDGKGANLHARDALLVLHVELDANPETAKVGRCMIAKPDFVALMCGERRSAVVRIYAHPPGRAGMFGGHWVHASGDNFPTDTPIPVYDRFE